MSNTVLYWELLFCNDDFDSFQAEIINFTDQMLKNVIVDLSSIQIKYYKCSHNKKGQVLSILVITLKVLKKYDM